jgi:hypothetical protein
MIDLEELQITKLKIREQLQPFDCGDADLNDFLSEKDEIACRFLTVDAYSTAFDFYLKNDFNFISTKDNRDSTRLMYFDLKR